VLCTLNKARRRDCLSTFVKSRRYMSVKALSQNQECTRTLTSITFNLPWSRESLALDVPRMFFTFNGKTINHKKTLNRKSSKGPYLRLGICNTILIWSHVDVFNIPSSHLLFPWFYLSFQGFPPPMQFFKCAWCLSKVQPGAA